MDQKVCSPKVIADPIHGIIDIRPVLPMVETEEFQALADKRQLGMTQLVFRSATHTRFAHCVGAYHTTRALADRWIKLGFVAQSIGDALAAYALYHDIGHAPFSHVTEDFCRLDNDGMSLELIRKLRDVIESCGADYSVVEKLASHENPLYLAVNDKNLGTEKLDYLERDGFYTILSRPAGVDYLRNHIYYIDGTVTIDEKVVEYAIDTQNFYMKMYKDVYFRKSLVIAQRMFHKAMHHLIMAGEISVENLPHLTDSELLGAMFHSADPSVNTFYGLLRRREFFREAISIRPEDFVCETRVAGKPIATFGIGPEEIKRLAGSPSLQKNNHASVERLENRIADLAGTEKGDILVVPVFNPERFRVKDVMIHGSDGKLHSLRGRRPAHFTGMEETARSYFALRICTLEKYRKILSSPETSRKIFEFVMEQA